MVKFNFSRADLSIRESEDLPSQISIVKTGENEPTISFQVFVYPVEGDPDETGKIELAIYSFNHCVDHTLTMITMLCALPVLSRAGPMQVPILVTNSIIDSVDVLQLIVYLSNFSNTGIIVQHDMWSILI